MKISEKTKEKKEKIKKKEKLIKPKKEHVLIVAQEIKFARLLSGNEKKTRDKVLKTLKKWLLNCFEKGYEFKEDDFIRVWKGLFNAVWMSDKPLVQEELCENISAVLDLFPEEHLRHALLMYKAGLRVLATEWYGLDQHRIDKFLMLVRRWLRGSLRCLSRCKWSLQSCQAYAKMLSSSDGIFALKTPHYARNSMSMLLHIVDCYLEEIAKVSGGSIPDASVAALLRPLCALLGGGGGGRGGGAPPLAAAARRVLTALLRQSPPGLRYQHATAAWQKMGCPEGGPEALELVSDDEEDEEEQQNGDEMSGDEDDSSARPLDPRAGRVNVELPLLPVPAALLADELRQLLPSCSSSRRTRVSLCMQRFEQLSRGEYPLRVRTHTEEDGPEPVVKPKKSAASLHALEKKLVAASDELALRGLGRKHRKRLLAKSRSGVSIVEEVEAVRQKLSTEVTNGGWQVESAEPEAKKPKQNTSNKENNKRKNNAVNGKKRKVEAKVNGDATHKRLKVDKKDKVDTESLAVSNKLDNVSLNNVENIDKVKQNGKNKVSKGNDILKDNIKNYDKTVTEIKTQSNEKKQKNDNKFILKDQNKTPESPSSPKSQNKIAKIGKNTIIAKNPTLLVNKVKQFQKQTKKAERKNQNSHFDTPKKVKFVLKNNSMQQPVDYYKSVRQSPNIPFDSAKKPTKTNLKPSTPSPINPFLKKKMRLRK